MLTEVLAPYPSSGAPGESAALAQRIAPSVAPAHIPQTPEATPAAAVVAAAAEEGV